MKNEPAFPHKESDNRIGLTLLDYFAAKAMQALISKLPLHDRDGEFSKQYTQEEIDKIQADVCWSSYGYAEKMLKERENREGGNQ